MFASSQASMPCQHGSEIYKRVRGVPTHHEQAWILRYKHEEEWEVVVAWCDSILGGNLTFSICSPPYRLCCAKIRLLIEIRKFVGWNYWTALLLGPLPEHLRDFEYCATFENSDNVYHRNPQSYHKTRTWFNTYTWDCISFSIAVGHTHAQSDLAELQRPSITRMDRLLCYYLQLLFVLVSLFILIARQTPVHKSGTPIPAKKILIILLSVCIIPVF